MSSNDDLVDFYANSSEKKYEYFYQPCLFAASSKEMIFKLMNPESLSEEKIKEYLAFCDKESSYFKKKRVLNIFSLDGLYDFLDNGMVCEVPQNLYIKPELEDRIIILKNMIELLKNNEFQYRIYKEDVYLGSDSLTISVSEKSMKIICRTDEQYILINMQEYDTIYSFFDYIDFICQNDMIYSKEETIEILENILADKLSEQ